MDKNQNLANFQQKAILSKREVVLCVDEWIKKCEDNDFKIEICNKAKEILHDRLICFRNTILSSPGIRDLKKPYATYTVNIFDDFIQLGYKVWDDGTEFDEDGMALDGDYSFEPIIHTPIPTVTLMEWCRINNVKPVTARLWINKGRMRAAKDGRDLHVSAIQYKPDAIYADKKKCVRYRLHMTLPESISKKYPVLAGTVDLIMLYPLDDESNMYKLLVISQIDSKEELYPQSMKITMDERDALIKALNDIDGLCSVNDQHFSSPLGKISSGKKYRFPQVRLTEEDIKNCKGKNIAGDCIAKNIFSEKIPEFSLVMSDKDEELCSVSGGLLVTDGNAERRLLRAIFDDGDYCEIRNRVLSELKTSMRLNYPWDKKVLCIKNLALGGTAETEKVRSFLRGLAYFVHSAFAYDATLVIFALPASDADISQKSDLLISSGYKALDEGSEPYEDYKIFYAYV